MTEISIIPRKFFFGAAPGYGSGSPKGGSLRRALNRIGPGTVGRYLFDLRNDPRRAIWIVGDGRSGTTWLGELLTRAGGLRNMFEPFHPFEIESAARFNPFQYERSTACVPDLERFFRSVFTGKFAHPRVDRFETGLLFRGRVVKDIFANLLLGWADSRFPGVAKIVMVRHPFAVAASKSRLKNWGWVNDPGKLLNQENLVEDWLGPYRPLLETRMSPFLRIVTVWAAVHFVMFRLIPPGGIHLVFYEDLCFEGKEELQRLEGFLLGAGSPIRANQLRPENLEKPSRLTARGDFKGSREAATRWMAEIGKQEQLSAMRILERFGLDNLYGTDVRPNPEVVGKLISHPQWKES